MSVIFVEVIFEVVRVVGTDGGIVSCDGVLFGVLNVASGDALTLQILSLERTR